jgi:predicted small secreted protein
MRKILLWTMLAASVAIAGCNTVKGAGQDVSAAGHAVSDTAQDAKPH